MFGVNSELSLCSVSVVGLLSVILFTFLLRAVLEMRRTGKNGYAFFPYIFSWVGCKGGKGCRICCCGLKETMNCACVHKYVNIYRWNIFKYDLSSLSKWILICKWCELFWYLLMTFFAVTSNWFHSYSTEWDCSLLPWLLFYIINFCSQDDVALVCPVLTVKKSWFLSTSFRDTEKLNNSVQDLIKILSCNTFNKVSRIIYIYIILYIL